MTGRKSYGRKSLTLFCRQIRFADSLTERDAAKWKLLQNCIFSKQLYSWDCFDKLSLRFVFRVTTKWNWSFQGNSAVYNFDSYWITEKVTYSADIRLELWTTKIRWFFVSDWLLYSTHQYWEQHNTSYFGSINLSTQQRGLEVMVCVYNSLSTQTSFSAFFLFLLGISEKMVISKKY